MTSPTSPLTILLLFLLTTLAGHATAEDPSESPLPTDVLQAVKEMCDGYAERIMPGILEYDEDGDGKVQLRPLVSELMKRGFARTSPFPPGMDDELERSKFARSQEWQANADREIAKEFGTDDEGNILKTGVSSAIQSMMLGYLNRMGPLDVDKDGKLNFKEYAMGFPVTDKQEVDEDGHTEEQYEYFKKNDKDRDGFIKGKEYIGEQDYWLNLLVGKFVGILMIPKADTNGDETLSREELAAILPDAEELPESVPLAESVYWIRELEEEEIAALEKNLSKLPSET